MKPVRQIGTMIGTMVGTGALFLLLGIGLPLYAQQDNHPDQHEDSGKPANQDQAKPQDQGRPAAPAAQPKPAQPQDQPKPARPEDQPKTAKPQDQAKPQAEAKPQDQAKPARQQVETKPAKPAKTEQAKPQQQAQTNQQGHVQRSAAQQQRQNSQPAVRVSERTSVRIPDARFQANFGQGHAFRMGNPRMVGGYSRFQYGGFWFGFVQPWPVDWYYTDDVYIDYIDGEYFLFDPYYPGERMEISVVM
jgi:outer membrane biosynthesis protein TonB